MLKLSVKKADFIVISLGVNIMENIKKFVLKKTLSRFMGTSKGYW